MQEMGNQPSVLTTAAPSRADLIAVLGPTILSSNGDNTSQEKNDSGDGNLNHGERLGEGIRGTDCIRVNECQDVQRVNLTKVKDEEEEEEGTGGN